ncbi:FTR1 family iron permease [Candidatus Nitrosocosmicus arcticus]|uniref:FTR1 family iron permease n=1 Tax=Candidatus Nitrosocosmicus arcticus TaxID=2035267 RepID=UPI0016464711|nr:FTR1 family protein [Candidatus Nitrosocosmicus arcticus]
MLTSIFFLVSVGIVLGFNDNNNSNYSSVFGIDVTKKINLSPEEAQMIFLNLERINSQIDLTAQNLKDNDTEGAFYHSYIPHSVTYPTIKQALDKVDPSASIKLEGLLTDLPIFVNSKSKNESPSSDVFSSVNLESNLNQIQKTTKNLTGTLLINRVNGTNPSDILPILSNNDLLTLQTSLLLLDDSLQSYLKSNLSNVKSAEHSINPLNLVDYQNSMGLLDSSERLLFSIISLDSNTLSESQLYYDEIENAIRDKQDSQIISNLINSVKSNYDAISPTDVTPYYTNENAVYFKNIHELLSKVIESISIGNYSQADKYAIEAYLDNYEYLEAPIEKINSTLKNALEINLRENLIDKIDARQPLSEISLFVNKTIIPELLIVESLLQGHYSTIIQQPDIQSANQLDNRTSFTSSIANLDSLREGFGVYTGERKVMGDVADSQKQLVRNNVDEIRLGLNKILALYKEQKYDESISEARAVYLNSYENIEIPLRPINPDFTLDVEIKFAELRNLLQQKESYEIIEKKIIEIRNGLDESERLVSGTGIIAPTIAFSSSISIIFREGLESALIIGAMLTYLEASRNEKFKKHIYLGIILAIGATAIIWIIADHMIQITGASRELIEGVAGVSAVAVLFWVSFWVLNKIETKKWIEFVKSKVWQATTTGSVMVFVLLSFFTIFREGFETVLFYQSMFSYAKYMESYVIAGLLIGLAIVIFVAFIIKKLGKRLPLRVLFGMTMGIGAYMSVAFIGNAVRSFQEADYIHTTPLIGIIPRLDINIASMTGIHPTLETFVAQLILLGIYAVGSTYVLILLPRKKKKIELSRKSMAERYSTKSD